MNTSTIVNKLWNYYNMLRDDCMNYGATAKSSMLLSFDS